jgi:prophage regulatory protein
LYHFKGFFHVPEHSAEHGKDAMLQAIEKILRRSQLESVLNIKRSAIYERLANDPAFPKPVRLGEGRAVGWLESEIIAWQQKRKAERDRPMAPPKKRRAQRRSKAA